MCSVSEDSELTPTPTPHKDAPWRVAVKVPSGRAEERSFSRIRAARCLSAASLRGPREKRAPQVARSEAEGRAQWGRLSLVTFFGETKKVTRLPGRHPGSGLTTTARYPIKRPVAPTPALPQRG